MSFNPCAIVPSHDHWQVLPTIVAQLRRLGLPVFVIDDGSGQTAAAAMAALYDPAAGVTVHRLPVNQGKGAAVLAGFQLAQAAGYSHALQIDADGQHDLAALAPLLRQARAAPEALISGRPRYDRSVPWGRRLGRWLTHVWVFAETLSLRITDSMCGFRVYPLAMVARLPAAELAGIGRRMEFDTEIMVRLFWRGVPPVMLPVRVSYPPGNRSNFNLLRDNWRITRMHVRLMLTLMVRWPAILRQRPPPVPHPSRHWAALAERGAGLGLTLAALAYRALGRAGCMAVLAPVVGYFFLTGAEQRRASRRFLARAHAANGGTPSRPPGWWQVYRHFMSFTGRALDGFAAWAGAIPTHALVAEDVAGLATAAANPHGALLVVSHIGNAELARALMLPALRDRLTVLVHTRHAENYNRLLARFNPAAAARLVQVTEVGPDTAIQLRERIERGEWVAIAGDRVPVGAGGRTCRADFLGYPAAFSQGPWLLAALLDCPVYLLFCRRTGAVWRLRLEAFAPRIVLPRGSRLPAVESYVARYAARLEAEALADPLQWYNFFDFWAAAGEQ